MHRARRRLVATSAKTCRDSGGCWTFGRCTLSGDECIAASDEDCGASTIAFREQRECVARGGYCHRPEAKAR